MRNEELIYSLSLRSSYGIDYFVIYQAEQVRYPKNDLKIYADLENNSILKTIRDKNFLLKKCLKLEKMFSEHFGKKLYLSGQIEIFERKINSLL